MDLKTFEADLSEGERESVRLSLDFLRGLPLDPGISKIEMDSSFAVLASIITAHKPHRGALFQEANLGLSRRRNAVRERLGIPAETPARQQVEAVKQDAEGSAVLNAFMVFNTPLVYVAAKQYRDRVGLRRGGLSDYAFIRQFDAGDLVQFGMCGVPFKSNDSLAAYGGLPDVAMKYDPEYGTRFGTYLKTALFHLFDALMTHASDHNGTIAFTDLQSLENSDSDNSMPLSAQFAAHPGAAESHHLVSRSELLHTRAERLREILGRLSMHERKTVEGVQNGESFKDIGEHLGISARRVPEIYSLAMRRIRRNITEDTLER